MKVYSKTGSFLLCGHWNGSPLEIGLTGVMTAVPDGEAYHYHDFHEYYVILQGRGTLLVEGRETPLTAGTVVMVEPGERHRVARVDPNEGVEWVIIKEKSDPRGRIVVEEAEG